MAIIFAISTIGKPISNIYLLNKISFYKNIYEILCYFWKLLLMELFVQKGNPACSGVLLSRVHAKHRLYLFLFPITTSTARSPVIKPKYHKPTETSGSLNGPKWRTDEITARSGDFAPKPSTLPDTRVSCR